MILLRRWPQCSEKSVKLDGKVNKSHLIDSLEIDSRICRTCLLINEPKFMSPLQVAPITDLTERYVIIAGSELGNGYSELNDPTDQLAGS